jgi:hypothetical protein
VPSSHDPVIRMFHCLFIVLKIPLFSTPSSHSLFWHFGPLLKLTYFQHRPEMKLLLSDSVSLLSRGQIFIYLWWYRESWENSKEYNRESSDKFLRCFTLESGINRLRLNERMTRVIKTTKVANAAFSKSVNCTWKGKRTRFEKEHVNRCIESYEQMY